MAKLTSFRLDIRPLFTERDIHAMSKAFDLANYDDVKAHAAAIYDRIRGIGGAVMPPPPPRGEGPWPQSRIDLFAKMDGGRVSTLRWEPSMSTGADQSAELKFVVTNTLIVGDIRRSVAFYRDVLGATVLREGEPTFLRLGNIWLTINGGGGGTDDKPEVVAAPPRDPNVLSNFINLRVSDIKRCYELWSSRGAKFITEPKVHATEMRCYMRDPDGYLIEVGQTTMTAGPLDLYM
jgi:catechol 2,3-dioxygenase-like lactoylglutathione lyase family enzyme